MQQPRVIQRRNRRFPLMLVMALGLAILWMGFHFLVKIPTGSKHVENGPISPAAKQSSLEPAESLTEEEMKKAAEEAAFEKQAVSEDSNTNYLDSALDDPMSSFVVGYPTQPHSLESLKLCDTAQTIILHGSYKCADDPSCLKCIDQKQQDRYHEVRNAYRDPEIQEARHKYIKEQFVGQQTIVLFAFNFAHSDLFLNWACSVRKIGLDPKSFTFVVPCDEKSTALVKRLGFKHADPAWQKNLHRPIRSGESFWGNDHADINNLSLYTMIDLVKLGFHVFVHDADVVWLKNPFPFFEKSIRRRDFMGMLAPFWNSMGPINTGLLFLAPTNQLKVFLETMENAAIIKGTSDQRLWNTVLRHFSFQQLEWRILPQAVVYKYSGRHAPPPDERTLLLHALGSDKREKLNRMKLWYLDSECAYYDADSAALAQKELEKARAKEQKKSDETNK